MATTRFDAAEYLAEPEAQAEFLALRLEDGTADEIRSAINIIARARGMSDLAKVTGIRREHLYRVLGEDGNPEFATILTIVRALGLKLSASPQPVRSKTQPKRKAGKKAGRHAA